MSKMETMETEVEDYSAYDQNVDDIEKENEIYDEGFELDILAIDFANKIPTREYPYLEGRYDIAHEAGENAVYFGVGNGEDDFNEFEALVNYMRSKDIMTDSSGVPLEDVLAEVKSNVYDYEDDED